MGDCCNIKACHYVLQHFSLKKRGTGFTTLRMRITSIFLFCVMLLHKKGAALK
jgi:hypothetical protein